MAEKQRQRFQSQNEIQSEFFAEDRQSPYRKKRYAVRRYEIQAISLGYRHHGDLWKFLKRDNQQALHQTI